MSIMIMAITTITGMAKKSTPIMTIATTIMAITTLTLGRTCSRPRSTSPIFVMD